MNPWEQIKYFKPQEFDSPDEPGSGARMNFELVKILDQIREKCGFPFPVNSGYRTAAHNATLKDSVNDSAHCSGNACDISIDGDNQRFMVTKWAILMGIRRIGIARSFIHLDMDYTKPQEVFWLY